jgi:hypothetical protein
MPCFPQDTSGLNYISYPVGPAATDITITNPVSTNTKGAYSELVASTPFACTQVIWFNGFVAGSAARQVLIDLSTGAGGAETVVVADLLSEVMAVSTSWNPNLFTLPLAIAASTRVAARYAINVLAGAGLSVHLTIWAAGTCPGITSFTTLGANSADSGGTQIDPGGVADTKGAYVELVASSAAVTQFLMLMSTMQGNQAAASTRWARDVATGAGGAETVLMPDLGMSSSSLDAMAPRSLSFLTYIAASTRIAIRASCAITDATDRLFDVALVVGTAPAESGSGGLSRHPGMAGGMNA